MKTIHEALKTLKHSPEGQSSPLTVAVLEAMAVEMEKKPKAAPVAKAPKPKPKKKTA